MATTSASTDPPTTTRPATPQLHDPNSGAPVSWDTASSGPPGPTPIAVAIADHNAPADQGSGLAFDAPWPAAFTPLLKAAERVWEEIANVQFINVSTDSDSPPADIRVGLADISAGLNPPKFLYFLDQHWGGGGVHDYFHPGNRLAIGDPNVTPVTALSDGDFQYVGLQTTVFQALVSGLGALLGLDINPTDPTSIRYPSLSSKNPLPDAQDIATAQAIYGKGPGSALALPPDQAAVLAHLTYLRDSG
jgi:hypothetical protein